ncbi:MAG: hypothetical protein KDK97_12425 [Verrucomicrobiales bacterium]|nr:hypothetical protein [Verrucomicrobiales bacterium]
MPNSSKPNSPPEPDMQPWQPRPPRSLLGNLSRLLFLLALTLALILPFTPFAGKIRRAIEDIVKSSREPKIITREVPVERTVEKTVEVIRTVEVEAPPPPLPSKFIPRKDIDVASLFNGVTIKTNVSTEEGNYASLERENADAYKAEFQLNIRIPKANQTLEELKRVNDQLPTVLPGLGTLLETAKVSPFYHKLYDNKTNMVVRDLTRLNKVLDRHNFFDCETILELKSDATSRRALLIQSEMDVVCDGSDGDRQPALGDYIYLSDYYQPFTSYAWSKTSPTPNPLLPRWESRLAKAKADFAVKGLSAERNRELKASIDLLGREISDMKSRSSLIAEKDPFIVISLIFRGYAGKDPFAPTAGDYAVVIHEGKIYPAICGDYGPSFKMGEASLMMAKTINPKATPYSRPVSDLKVTYLVFPGTAEKPFSAPDMQKWHDKCLAYINEIGGLGAGVALHEWQDPFKKPEPPAATAVTPTTVEPPATAAPDATATSPAAPTPPTTGEQ